MLSKNRSHQTIQWSLFLSFGYTGHSSACLLQRLDHSEAFLHLDSKELAKERCGSSSLILNSNDNHDNFIYNTLVVRNDAYIHFRTLETWFLDTEALSIDVTVCYSCKCSYLYTLTFCNKKTFCQSLHDLTKFVIFMLFFIVQLYYYC